MSCFTQSLPLGYHADNANLTFSELLMICIRIEAAKILFSQQVVTQISWIIDKLPPILKNEHDRLEMVRIKANPNLNFWVQFYVRPASIRPRVPHCRRSIMYDVWLQLLQSAACSQRCDLHTASMNSQTYTVHTQ